MRRCPVCGESNPARARFCLNCGSPLGALEPARPEERRLVTVLFCDLVGFTARSDRADPEEVKGTLRPFHARVQREIEHHGGWVSEFLGDGVLAIFGAPIAHEDDPERAVRAGLRIQEAIEELNAEHPELALTARIGIETGEAVVTFAQGPQIGGTVTGDVTNTASRLQGVAPPGGIVVGEATYRATATEFRYRELDPVTVKGKADPLRIWEPLAAASRLPEDARRRSATPLVGRTEELATLERLLLRTVRDGMPGFAVLTGEAGVGKSRMVNELAAIADGLPDLVRWRQGRPLPYGEGVAFSALAEVVKSEAGILESDPAEAATQKLRVALERTAPDPAERGALTDALGPLLGIAPPGLATGDAEEGWSGWGGPDVGRVETFALWRRFLELLATDHPLVLVFEDLHLASDPFLEFVDDLLDWSAGLPMLVLAVGRPELLQRRPQWVSWTAATHVRIDPLPEDDTRRLVDLLLHDTGLPAETVERVVGRAEGVPLYAEEFARMVRERGATDLAEQQEANVPPTLRALVAARLDGLPADERALLQDAAVVGRTFWTGALAAVTGAEPGRFDPVLRSLDERELIQRARTSTVGGEQEFAFSHALVRDVAYAQIPRRIRAGKHRAIAGWIERIAGDRVADRAEALAQQYGQALVLSRASGDAEAAAELLDPTVRYVRLAAERAMGFDAVRGHRLYTRALSMLPEGHPDRARTLRDAGGTATSLGRFDEAEGYLRRALDEYQRIGDQVGRADVMVAYSRLELERGNTESVGPLLDTALGLLEVYEPGPPLARAYARHAGYLFIVGDNEGALRRARQGLALARELRMGREEVLALNYLGGAQSLLGDPAGLDALQEAVRRGLDLGLGSETAIAMNNLAENLRYLQGPAASLDVWVELVALARERGLSTSLAWARMGEGGARFDLGEWDEVLAIEAEAEAWDRAHGVSPFGTTMRLLAGWVALRRGHLEGAVARTRDILPRVQRIGYAEYEAPAYAQLAELAVARGSEREARAMLDAFARASASDRLWRTTLLPVVVRILARLGDLERARALVTDPPPVMSERERLSLASARAILAEAEGDHARAAGAYREAVDGWRAYGMPIELGQLLVGLARCERSLGRVDAARDAARAAIEVLTPLDAHPLAREAEGLLAPTEA
jgi:class 3 adenylate cyclase/tetratricopeptide (TPR) repeat protein